MQAESHSFSIRGVSRSFCLGFGHFLFCFLIYFRIAFQRGKCWPPKPSLKMGFEPFPSSWVAQLNLTEKKIVSISWYIHWPENFIPKKSIDNKSNRIIILIYYFYRSCFWMSTFDNIFLRYKYMTADWNLNSLKFLFNLKTSKSLVNNDKVTHNNYFNRCAYIFTKLCSMD